MEGDSLNDYMVCIWLANIENRILLTSNAKMFASSTQIQNTLSQVPFNVYNAAIVNADPKSPINVTSLYSKVYF